MKSKILFLSICLFITSISFAQMLKGRVTDAATGKALERASIISSARNSALTDSEGNFSIKCSGASRLTASFVGYKSVTKKIKFCEQIINISLSKIEDSLTEVVIISGECFPVDKSLHYSESSVTKLTPIELKRGLGLFLSDAINGNIPGVQMQSRAVSSGQQFNIRGYGNGVRGTNGLNSNFDGQGYKLYLNGMPVTDAEGITTMDDIDFGSIGNVEVSKGPAGTLYGLAISGAVNLTTIKPAAGKTTIGQDVLFGSYGLQRYTTQLAMGKEKSSILINYGKQKTDGYTIHNASKKDFINFIGEFKPNYKQTVNTYISYSNSYDERNGEDSVAQWLAGDYSGNIEYVKRNAHSEVFTVRAGVGHTYNFKNNIANTTTVFGTAFNSNASSAGGWTDKATTNFGVRCTFDTRLNIGNYRLSGITGLEIERQNGTTIGYDMIDPLGSTHIWKYGDPYFIIGSTNPATINGTRSNVYATTQNSNIFTEWTLALQKDLSITAGLGISSMKIGLNDRFYQSEIPNKVRQFDTKYKGLVSPHVAINKVFNNKVSAYVSYSKGYKAPVSSYFYIPAVVGGTAATTFNGDVNNTLKPEIGNQFEIGTKGNLLDRKLTYQVALFKAVYANKMTVIAVPNPANTVTLYTYVANGGKQDNKGLEAAVRYTAYQSAKGFIKTITPYGNLTSSNFKYKDFILQSKGKSKITPSLDSTITVDFSGYDVAGVPKFVGNLGIDIVSNMGLYFSLSYYYKDGFSITSDGMVKIGGVIQQFKTDSYSLINSKIGYQSSLSKHFDIDAYFGVNNMTGTKTPQMVFTNQIPDAFLVGPLKAVGFGGVNLKYNF